MNSFNPYDAPQASSESTGVSVACPSTWRRNRAALGVVVALYSIVCGSFAIARSAIPEGLFVLLISASGVASLWANVPLGPRLGWSRGGFPVVVIAVFFAMTVYMLTALVVGGTAYELIHPK